MTSSKQHVINAMHDGKITHREADAYMRAVHDTSLGDIEQRRHVMAYTIIVVLVAAVIGGMFLLPGGPTGFVVYDIPEEAHNVTNTSIPIIGNITGISVAGSMYGEGTATVTFASDTSYTVATIVSDTGAPRTTKASYLPGENVTLDNVLEATYYLDDGEQSVVVTVPFAAPAVGSYEILVLSNDSGTLESTRVPLLVSETPSERVTTFTTTCGEACILPGIENGTLIIQTDGPLLDLSLIDVDIGGENQEPIAETMPDLTITEPVTIDMAASFTDPEESVLFYSTSTSDLVSTEIVGSLLTITPVQSGTDLFIVYASDLEHLVQSTFTIIVATSEVPPETNISENITTNVTENVTVNITDTNVTQTETNITIISPRCADPNPNLRPLDCLQQEAEEYFPTEVVFWEDNYRVKAGKFNQLGNLLIMGDLVEFSSGAPDSDDFRLGNVDRDGNLDATIWVDDQGNLHLVGRLHEEQTVMQPPPGSYSILSKRSIYLAYADLGTGDLYLRGNLIPYRRSLG